MEQMQENNVIVVYRRVSKDKDKKVEDIGAMFNRLLLNIRRKLDKFDNVILDARRENISFAFELSMSKILDGIAKINIQNIEVGVLEVKDKKGILRRRVFVRIPLVKV